jgi:serine/threonine protein kinase
MARARSTAAYSGSSDSSESGGDDAARGGASERDAAQRGSAASRKDEGAGAPNISDSPVALLARADAPPPLLTPPGSLLRAGAPASLGAALGLALPADVVVGFGPLPSRCSSIEGGAHRGGAM